MNLENITNKLKKIISCLFPIVLTLGIVAWLFGLDINSLNVPFEYRSDSLFSAAFIKGILENGWFLHNPSLGQPTGLYLYDWFSADTLFVLMIKGFGLFSSNWAWVMNVFYLSTFALATLTSYLVLRHLKVAFPLSCTFSILFSLLPYHFARGESHLFLSGYFMIPLITLVLLYLSSGQLDLKAPPASSTSIPPSNKGKLLASFLIVILTAMTGVYYAFFTCLFLAIAALIAISRDRTRLSSHLASAGVLIFTILLTVVIQVLPNLVYQMQHGRNTLNPERHASQAESLGLKLDQLVLPVTGHRVPFLASMKDRYNQNFPLVNENDSASLGIIASFGLLLLLFWLFFRPNVHQPKTHDHDYLSALAVLGGAAVLVGTIGGLGALIAMIINPMIRSYNRISIFIGFFALATLALLLQQLFNRLASWKWQRVLVISLSACLMVIGILDQTVASRSTNQSRFKSDQTYFSSLEATIPAGSAIFQLPYVFFPESPPLYDLASYDLLRPYLHTDKLTWSFGAMQGREADEWQQSLTKLPVQDLFLQIRDNGFTGILIDRAGFADRAVKLEAELKTLVFSTPLVSDDQRYAFYSID